MKSKLIIWVSALAFLTVAGCECTQNNQNDTITKDNEAIEAQLAQMSLRQRWDSSSAPARKPWIRYSPPPAAE